jgi:hypothetical protein
MKNDFHPVFLRYCPWLPDPLPWVAMGTYQVCSAYIQNNECLLKKARKGRRLLLRSPDLSAASARVALSTHLGLRFLLVKGPFPPQVGIDFCFSGGDALMIAGLFFKGKGWLVLLTRYLPSINPSLLPAASLSTQSPFRTSVLSYSGTKLNRAIQASRS